MVMAYHVVLEDIFLPFLHLNFHQLLCSLEADLAIFLLYISAEIQLNPECPPFSRQLEILGTMVAYHCVEFPIKTNIFRTERNSFSYH